MENLFSYQVDYLSYLVIVMRNYPVHTGLSHWEAAIPGQVQHDRIGSHSVFCTILSIVLQEDSSSCIWPISRLVTVYRRWEPRLEQPSSPAPGRLRRGNDAVTGEAVGDTTGERKDRQTRG